MKLNKIEKVPFVQKCLIIIPHSNTVMQNFTCALKRLTLKQLTLNRLAVLELADLELALLELAVLKSSRFRDSCFTGEPEFHFKLFAKKVIIKGTFSKMINLCLLASFATVSRLQMLIRLWFFNYSRISSEFFNSKEFRSEKQPASPISIWLKQVALVHFKVVIFYALCQL